MPPLPVLSIAGELVPRGSRYQCRILKSPAKSVVCLINHERTKEQAHKIKRRYLPLHSMLVALLICVLRRVLSDYQAVIEDPPGDLLRLLLGGRGEEVRDCLL